MPAHIGARSRAVDDRDRSSSSSDPGSAIEGFRQKIPFHNKLTDLGVKLGDLASRLFSRSVPFSANTWASFSTASRFQASICVGCNSCLVASSATVSWPLIASSATLALNSAENRLRVLMVVRPLHQQTHLSRLSHEVGPPLFKHLT